MGVVTGPGLFEEEFGEVLGGWVGEEGETVVTAEGEEVEGFGLVEASQAGRAWRDRHSGVWGGNPLIAVGCDEWGTELFKGRQDDLVF